MKYKFNFRITDIDINVESNIDIFLQEPEPFNLHINYFIQAQNVNRSRKFYKIIILHKEENSIELTFKDDVFTIIGDLSPMLQEGYNKQFSLFGNKGVINRFILHLIETDLNAAVFHGCAVQHPETNKTLIGFGASGSGKSTFIANALKVGWKLIASEHIIIDNKLNIFKGNEYDNVSPLGLDFLRNNLREAVIYSDKKLVEPVGEKVFVNFHKYSISDLSLSLNTAKSTIVVLNFGNNKIPEAMAIQDKDFLLRVLQITSSEKITFPPIFGDTIFKINLNGNCDIRSVVINKLIEHTAGAVVLGGNYESFESYLWHQLK